MAIKSMFRSSGGIKTLTVGAVNCREHICAEVRLKRSETDYMGALVTSRSINYLEA